MTVETWLAAAQQDAEKRGLRELLPLLETLGRSTAAEDVDYVVESVVEVVGKVRRAMPVGAA